MCLALEKDTSTNFLLCFSVSSVFSYFGVSTVCLLGLQFISLLVPLTGIAATGKISTWNIFMGSVLGQYMTPVVKEMAKDWRF